MTERVQPDQFDPSWIDPEAAIKFLVALRPNGPWALTAIYPDDKAKRAKGDTGPAPTRTFSDVEPARAWILDRADRANLYYHVNQTGMIARKASKADVTTVDHVHVEIDDDRQGPLAGDTDRKAAVVAVLQTWRRPGPPSLIVDSGGGVQALWHLDTDTGAVPQPVAEAINAKLIEEFGGDTGTANCDRLLRLPGTINFPDAKKRKRGRVPAPTRLLVSSDRSYDEMNFDVVRPKPAEAALDVALGPPEFVEDLTALAEEHNLDADLVELIVSGTAPDREFASRSEALFSVVMRLLRLGVSDEVVLGIIQDDRFAIAESVLDRPDYDQERYAEHQVRSARSKLLAEVGRDFDDHVGVADALGSKVSPDAVAAAFSANWTSVGQRDVAEIPRTPWLVEGLLLNRDITLIGGRGGVGKSVHAWQIGVAVAMGIPFAWWPAPKESRGVLVLSGEDDIDEIERRISAGCQSMSVDRTALGDRFMVRNHRNIRLVTKDMKTGKVQRTPVWDEIRWAVSHLDIGLLIIDPLVKASGGFEESDNNDQDVLFEQIRALTEGRDCAVLLDDHFAKSGVGGDQTAIRGASAKVDAARIAATLTAMTEKDYNRIKPPRAREAYVLYSDPKQNYAKRIGSRWLELVEYPVGNGEVRPALRARNMTSFDDLVDPRTWEHRAAFLRLVGDGRDDPEHKGWPWCSTLKGQRDTRLDVAVAEKLDLNQSQARAWIKAFALEGSIDEVTWTSPTKNASKVWALDETYEEPTEE